jgi:hypothetical protein
VFWQERELATTSVLNKAISVAALLFLKAARGEDRYGAITQDIERKFAATWAEG